MSDIFNAFKGRKKEKWAQDFRRYVDLLSRCESLGKTESDELFSLMDSLGKTSEDAKHDREIQLAFARTKEFGDKAEALTAERDDLFRRVEESQVTSRQAIDRIEAEHRALYQQYRICEQQRIKAWTAKNDADDMAIRYRQLLGLLERDSGFAKPDPAADAARDEAGRKYIEDVHSGKIPPPQRNFGRINNIKSGDIVTPPPRPDQFKNANSEAIAQDMHVKAMAAHQAALEKRAAKEKAEAAAS
jgi:hypothetical protein